MRYLTSPVVSILGLTAITSAVMSSVDSSTYSAASLLTKNFYYYILRPEVHTTALVDLCTCALHGRRHFSGVTG